jgi:aryl-alcohol dehydrogenase
MQITAAVAREKFGRFSIEPVELTDPRPDELLVKVAASGMCQTDQHGRGGYYNTPLPAVFGHEGAGVVLAVGSGVTKFKPGDHVVMSFPWCGTCANCRRQMAWHCQKNFDLKMRGTRPDGSTLMSQHGKPVYSAFFQQSSFATHAIANERFAVKVANEAPLDLLGPLACSGQTGAGAVLNTMQPRPGDPFAVFGVGAVGLSALMAAKIAECDPIIAVDVHAHRLALARELGATHALDHAGGADIVRETAPSLATAYGSHSKRRLSRRSARGDRRADAGRNPRAPRRRAHGNRGFFRHAVPAIRPHGPRRDQGESQPQVFIPTLVDLLMQGRLPLERMITFYPFADINRATQDSSDGTTIKPVLRMPG